MASYALMKFRISNDFFDWEQAFYSAQPMARNAGIIEIFHDSAKGSLRALHVNKLFRVALRAWMA